MAHSLGLASAPQIEFMDKATAKADKKSKLQKLKEKIAKKKAEKRRKREAEEQKLKKSAEYQPGDDWSSEEEILVPAQKE